MVSRQHLHGIEGVLIASLLWGTTGVTASFAPDVSSFALGAATWGIGGVVLSMMALPSIRRRLTILLSQWPWLVVGAASVAIYPIAFYGSMHMAGVTVGTVVSIGSAPLFSALIEVVMDRARLSLGWLLGALLGIVGIALLCVAQKTVAHGEWVTQPSNSVGVALALVAGFTYALFSWSGHRLIQRGASSRSAMGAIFGLGGLCLWPVMIMTGGVFLHSWDNIAVGAYLVIVPLCIGYICFGFGLARISASTATTISLMEPVVAAILAALVVGERLPVLGWIGIALIFACLIFNALPAKGNTMSETAHL